MLRKAVKRRI